jgi:Peptidase propeptide and YPEB domain
MNQELNFSDPTWVEAFMKMKKSRIFTVGFALVVAAVTTGQAQPSEAQLMKETKVTKSQAEKTALTKVPDGIIKSAELEREHGLLIWSFDIAKPGTKKITEVQVDAKTGKIASVQIETPKDQATEAAAEKK